MKPKQFLDRCQAAFLADEPQVIPANVAKAMVAIVDYAIEQARMNPEMTCLNEDVAAFTAACEEIDQ